jgi:hypothetical protein
MHNTAYSLWRVNGCQQGIRSVASSGFFGGHESASKPPQAICKPLCHDMELRLLLEDFRNYCFGSNLISNEEFKLLFVPTGFSYNWNKKHKIYYCPTGWHSQKFKFFGLYNWKSVRTISEIETVITADYDANSDNLKINSIGHTDEQIKRLKNGLSELGENHKGLKYYVLPESDFYETDFRKNSHGGIQGYRYKDLRDYITLNDYNDVKRIAEELRKVTWR